MRGEETREESERCLLFICGSSIVEMVSEQTRRKKVEDQSSFLYERESNCCDMVTW
jgi:hypothetical protein